MKKKINFQFIAIAVLAVLATAVCLIFLYFHMVENQVKNNLQISAELLQETGYFGSYSTDSANIDFQAASDELRITWIAADGTVLYDNDAEASTLENHSDRPEIQDAFNHGTGECVRTSTTFQTNTVYYAELLDNGTVLRLAATERSILSYFLSSVPYVLLILVVIIILCSVISHFLTKQLIAPIERMAENMEDTSSEPAYKELVPFSNMIRRQHEDILASAKMRQDFTANVSHELKTPLTAISGYAELMENGMTDSEQTKHFSSEIRKNSERLLTLINDIIDLSKLDHGKGAAQFEEIDLDLLARDSLEGWRTIAFPNAISVFYQGNTCLIKGDRSLLTEALDNLVQNAIRYNNHGGNVWIRIGTKDNRPFIKVIDDGIGIPEVDREHVFERFYRVDKSRSKATGGTGLGLAIVKHIVELHSAEIKLTSKVGEGTEVRIEF